MESSATSSGADEVSWVSWFCGLVGNEVFCEVDRTFIEDTFNLFGLKEYLRKDFNKALLIILDKFGEEHGTFTVSFLL